MTPNLLNSEFGDRLYKELSPKFRKYPYTRGKGSNEPALPSVTGDNCGLQKLKKGAPKNYDFDKAIHRHI